MPDATCYAVECCAPEELHHFSDDHLVLWNIGDFGSADANEQAVADLIGLDPGHIIFTNGDCNYVGSYATAVGNYYGGWVGRKLFFPAPGNHDTDYNQLADYLAYFTIVKNRRYYNQKIGPVELFMVHSDPREPDGVTSTSFQALWLKARLSASKAYWKIVVIHHAPYSSDDTHGSTVASQWPFETWGADIVFSGHAHSYERLLVGTLYFIVNGLGGAAKRGFSTILSQSVVRYNADYGAAKLKASQKRLRLEFFNVKGVLIDSLTLVK